MQYRAVAGLLEGSRGAGRGPAGDWTGRGESENLGGRIGVRERPVDVTEIDSLDRRDTRQRTATYCDRSSEMVRKQIVENADEFGDHRRELKILGVGGSIASLPTITLPQFRPLSRR